MLKEDYIKALYPCLAENEDCPYFDWRYQKCAMFAQTNSFPWNECEEYHEAEMIDIFSRNVLDKLANM